MSVALETSASSEEGFRLLQQAALPARLRQMATSALAARISGDGCLAYALLQSEGAGSTLALWHTSGTPTVRLKRGGGR